MGVEVLAGGGVDVAEEIVDGRTGEIVIVGRDSATGVEELQADNGKTTMNRKKSNLLVFI